MPANSIEELNRLTKQLRGIADNNYWARPADQIPVTQPDGKRYVWNRINPNSHRLKGKIEAIKACLLYTSPSPRDRTRSRMPSSA